MMENAGRNLATAAMDRMAETWDSARYLILAGSGSNGGGGICAARHLANRGLKVILSMTGPAAAEGITAYQHQIYLAAGGKNVPSGDLKKVTADIIIDAIIGYNLQDAPRGTALEFMRWANSQQAPVLSLDIPSGLGATSGESPGEYIQPDTTVTLAWPKTGLLPEKTGKLYLSDIGIPQKVYEELGLKVSNPFGKSFLIPLYAGR